MSKKVLITGVAGFIGFHLAKLLLKEPYILIGIDNMNNYYDVNLKKDRLKELYKEAELLNKKLIIEEINISNKKDMELVFEKYKPDYVVNLAAQAGVRYSITNPSAYIESNIVGFSIILDLSKIYNVKHLIYASSSSVYGGNEKLPFLESDPVDHPVSLYAASKRSNELMAHTYSHLYQLPCTGLRFFTVYGPWGRPDMALYIFTKSILEGKRIKVFNNGDMIRDFTYVEDIVSSLALLLKKPARIDENFDKINPNPSKSWCPHRIFNIGNSMPVKLMEYIKIIEKETEKKAICEFLEMQPGDVKRTAANTDELEDWIGFKPTTTVEVGIKKFVKWYRNYHSI